MRLEEWRAKRQAGEQATLPSGLEVTLRKVNLLELAKRGGIPQTLQPLAEQALQGKRALTLTELAEIDEMAGIVAGACIVAPADLDPSELDFTDKMAIFQWANSGAATLSFRRQKQGDTVDAAPAE